jgi:hypothetical protein
MKNYASPLLDKWVVGAVKYISGKVNLIPYPITESRYF